MVWSTTNDHADYLQGLNDEQFVAEVNRHFQQSPPISSFPAGTLGSIFKSLLLPTPSSSSTSSSTSNLRFEKPPEIESVVGKRGSFPLQLMHASEYVSSRVALVGYVER